MNQDKKRENPQDHPDRNEDPITGTPGAHPVGTGVGAAAGAAAGAGGTAAIGAAAGTAVGPVGTIVGGAIGAVVGGLAGKAAAEQVNPTAEDAYWREHHRNEPYYKAGYAYEDYQPAYRLGYEGYARHGASGKSFDHLENDFRSEYDRHRGSSRLSWDEARDAARAAWDRVDRGRLENYINWEVVDKNENKIGTLECIWSDTSGEPSFIGVKTGWLFGRTHVVPANRVEVNDNRQRIRLPYAEEQVKNAPAYEAETEMSFEKEQEISQYYGTAAGGAAYASSGKHGTPESSGQTSAREGRTSRATPEQATIQLSEEQLRINKHEVEAGGVRLRKIVRTEVVNQPVELQREEIVIERVSPEEAKSGRQAAFKEQEVYIPLRREEATVEKETVMREEVRARKQKRTDRQEVSGEVRKEDIEIENKGEARTTTRRGKGSGPAEQIREREEQPRSQRRHET